MKRASAGLFAAMALVLVLGPAGPAFAIQQFKKAFDEAYVKPQPSSPAEKSLAEAVAKAKCNVCHQGTSKKNRNLYGQALDELLDRTADKDNAEKIRKSIADVAAKKSNPKDPKSPTFGDLIAAGKLPGGEPETGAQP